MERRLAFIGLLIAERAFFHGLTVISDPTLCQNTPLDAYRNATEKP